MRPPLGRRILAGVVDLYGLCYVALLPLVLAGAVAVFRQERTIRREVERARAMPKGVWREDPRREAELQAKRKELFARLFDDLGQQARQFLYSMGPTLEKNERFKATLDELIRHPYTTLAHQTYERGLAALKRHIRSPEGVEALGKLERFLKEEPLRRIFAHIREELDYRIGQIADYVGFQGLGARIRALMRPGPPAAPGTEVAEALHWTNLLDKVLEEKVDILPEMRANLSFLKGAAIFSGVLGILFLAFRDLVGRGRSFGKRHAALAVVDEATGEPATMRQLALRGVVLIALFPVEILLCASPRRLGDRVAGTRVVDAEAR